MVYINDPLANFHLLAIVNPIPAASSSWYLAVQETSINKSQYSNITTAFHPHNAQETKFSLASPNILHHCFRVTPDKQSEKKSISM